MIAVMNFRTAFTEFFAVRYPIALAPMGGSAGGALAAAVSNGGGLGLLGGGNGWDRDWFVHAARARTGAAREKPPFGAVSFPVSLDVAIITPVAQ
jgi:nitronate monooxygenase